jgi:hypothetical protein
VLILAASITVLSLPPDLFQLQVPVVKNPLTGENLWRAHLVSVSGVRSLPRPPREIFPPLRPASRASSEFHT